jgi:hypothetical protein
MSDDPTRHMPRDPDPYSQPPPQDPYPAYREEPPMSSGTKIALGLLIALVIGLGVALAVVAGDNGNDKKQVKTSTTATTSTDTSTSTETTTVTEPTTVTETETTTVTEEAPADEGGVAP